MLRRVLFLSMPFVACAGLLLGDVSFAAAHTTLLSSGSSLSSAADGVLVARRKRRRRRNKKPKPKPQAKPKQQEPEAAPAQAPEGGSGGAIPLGPGGRSRVDFDAMQIRGQTTKSGEVQILERKDTELKSMVKRRTSFREEIIETVFPERAGALK